jgi:hypothetical protein
MKKWLLTASVLAGAVALAVSDNPPGMASDGPVIRGGGTTIVHGGSGSGGSPPFAPVITKFAIHVVGGTGSFDCLALTPSTAAGSAGSGNFDNNVMYVVGQITSAKVTGQKASVTGTATITGLCSGTAVPFTANVERGGPGAALDLTIQKASCPGFIEPLLEGEITFGFGNQ